MTHVADTVSFYSLFYPLFVFLAIGGTGLLFNWLQTVVERNG